MSDFVHSDVPQVVVINGPEGSTTVEQENSDLAHVELGDNMVPAEEIDVPDPVPYRATTPEQDQANVDQLLKEGKITEEEHAKRSKEIAAIAKDPTLTEQPPKEEAPQLAKTPTKAKEDK